MSERLRKRTYGNSQLDPKYISLNTNSGGDKIIMYGSETGKGFTQLSEITLSGNAWVMSDYTFTYDDCIIYPLARKLGYKCGYVKVDPVSLDIEYISTSSLDSGYSYTVPYPILFKSSNGKLYGVRHPDSSYQELIVFNSLSDYKTGNYSNCYVNGSNFSFRSPNLEMNGSGIYDTEDGGVIILRDTAFTVTTSSYYEPYSIYYSSDGVNFKLVYLEEDSDSSDERYEYTVPYGSQCTYFEGNAIFSYNAYGRLKLIVVSLDKIKSASNEDTISSDSIVYPSPNFSSYDNYSLAAFNFGCRSGDYVYINCYSSDVTPETIYISTCMMSVDSYSCTVSNLIFSTTENSSLISAMTNTTGSYNSDIVVRQIKGGTLIYKAVDKYHSKTDLPYVLWNSNLGALSSLDDAEERECYGPVTRIKD